MGENMIQLNTMRKDIADKVIDLDVLREMDIDQEFFSEVGSIYLHQAGELIREFKSRVHVAERTQVRQIVHTLKGISAGIGAAAMADMCKQLERLEAFHSPKEITVMLHELDNIFEDTQFQIQRLMNDFSGVESFEPDASAEKFCGVTL